MYKWKVKKFFLENQPKTFFKQQRAEYQPNNLGGAAGAGSCHGNKNYGDLIFSRYILFGWLTTFGSQLDSVGCILSFALDIISGC